MGWAESAGRWEIAAQALRVDVLGIRAAVRCNDTPVLAAVEERLRAWQAEAPDSGARPLELDIDIDGALGGTGRVRIKAERMRLELAGPGARGWADAGLGRAAFRASERWAASGRLFDELIEPLLLFLVCHADRTPLHAAACLIDGMAIILAGPSGSGKSCLALAAKRAGLSVLSDDTVHIQLRPALRVWGLPRPIHVYPADAPQTARGAVRWRNGKRKRAIPHAADVPLVASSAVLCMLERGDRVAIEIVRGCVPIPPPLEPGFDLLPCQSAAAVSALAARGYARLTLGRDPAQSIAELLRRREALAEIAAG